VYFNFSLPFEIHDDNEILYRLGLDEDNQEFFQQQQDVPSNVEVVESGSVLPTEEAEQ
jgi:hypothetical protein